MLCEKIIQVDFSRHTHRKSKIGLQNLYFNKLLGGNRLIHPEIHVKRCLIMKIEEICLNRF